MNYLNQIINADAEAGLALLPDQSVNCCVTSPPYFNLRNYGVEGQIGLEETPEAFIARLVGVFRQVRRVLCDDGTLWVNIGDSYAGSGKGGNPEGSAWTGFVGNKGREDSAKTGKTALFGHKPKDLLGIPWLLAFALRADGWYLRQEVIWHKPNPMPESVTDRCTKAHESVFLLTKSPNYYFEPMLEPSVKGAAGSEFHTGKTGEHQMGRASTKPRSNRDSFKRANSKRAEPIVGQAQGTHRENREESEWDVETRNKRSVWTIATKPFADAHFATFPEELPALCIKAGCPEGGVVLDPFFGSGTTGIVARKLNRNFVGVELNPEYIAIANRRIYRELGMFAPESGLSPLPA